MLRLIHRSTVVGRYPRVVVLTVAFNVVLIAMLALFTPVTHAAEDADMQGYDSIVNELNREANRPILRAQQASRAANDPFESVLFHGGLGVATLMEMVNFADGSHVFLGQKGIQAAFGIDLFSPNWLAEGTARTFAESEDPPIHVSLQEFELKVITHDRLSHELGYRMGAGLSARYMNVRHGADSTTYTTPTGLATAGLDLFLSEKASVGVEVTGRSAMITDTPDKNSIDATLRVDFHL